MPIPDGYLIEIKKKSKKWGDEFVIPAKAGIQPAILMQLIAVALPPPHPRHGASCEAPFHPPGLGVPPKDPRTPTTGAICVAIAPWTTPLVG